MTNPFKRFKKEPDCQKGLITREELEGDSFFDVTTDDTFYILPNTEDDKLQMLVQVEKVLFFWSEKSGMVRLQAANVIKD